MNKTSETNHLIESLTNDLKPTPQLAGVSRRWLYWLMATVAILGGAIAWGNANLSANDWFFKVHLAVLCVGGLLTAFLAVRFSVPGRDQGSIIKPLTLGLVALWPLIIGLQIFSKGGGPMMATHYCPTLITVLSVPLVAILTYQVSQGAPLQTRWIAFFASAAGVFSAALVPQLICPGQSGAHIGLFHFAPSVAIGALLFSLAVKVLSRPLKTH